MTLTRSTPTLIVIALMLSSTLAGLLPMLSEPVDALTFEVDTSQDLMGSGDNVAVLDSLVIDSGDIRLDTEVYPIRDNAWSEGNALNMVVDDKNKPKLDFASHWSTDPGYDNSGDFMHTAVYDRDRAQVLVYGGVHDEGGARYAHNALWSYNAGTGSWTQLNPVNRAKFLHTAVWADSLHMMIVFGGLTVSGSQSYLLDETLVYWPANDSWALMAACPYGGLVLHTSVWDSVNDQMLVAGGTPDGTWENVTNELWAFRPRTNTWTKLASFAANQARGGAASCWDTENDQMVMFGGRRGDNNPMSSVLSYKPSTNAWTQRGNSPVTRMLHSMSWDPVGGKAYTYGGITGTTLSSRMYQYDPLPDSWRELENAPDARYWSAFVWDSNNGVGLNFAGAAETGNPPITSYNDVMTYRTEVPFQSSGWLTSAYFDVAGVVSMGNLSWTPASQPTACGPDAVKFQVASSSMLETPTDFVGPDGTSSTYFTDPAGTPVGDHHFGAGRVAYRMYFNTDDNTITPSIDSVSLDVHRYAGRGEYTSPVYDLQQERSSLERVTYRSEIPAGSNPNLVKVTVKIRTSKNADMSSPTAWETVEKDDADITIQYGRYLQFQVVLNTDTQKRHVTPVFKGITVEYNSPPILTAGQIDRVSGDRTSWFEYTVTYTDVDNDEPTVSYVYIDGSPFPLTSPDLDFTNGAAFSYTTRLGLGEHEFYFEFSDGKNTIRDPPVGVYTGPEVLNRDPVPIIDFPSSGTRFTPSEPAQFSAATSYDPDGDDLEFRWTSSIMGELSDSNAFIKKMTEGSHIITLEVTDEHGATNSTEIAVLVKARVPELEIRDLYFDKSSPVEKDRVVVNVVVYNNGEVAASPAVVEFLVNNEVVDTYLEPLDVGERLVATFTWTASGDRNYLGARALPGQGADPDHELVEELDVRANTPPEIRADVYPLSTYLNEPVNFVNNGTSDVDGDKLSFVWDFGDGMTATDATAQHTYLLKGTYSVKLTVSDTRGGTAEKEWFVIVDKRPEEGSSSLPVALLGAVAAIVVVILLVLFLVLSRRRGGQVEPDVPAADPAPGAPEEAPRRRPLPPPPPPPRDEYIPGSPLEEMDNPYYQYDYGAGVPDEPAHGEDQYPVEEAPDPEGPGDEGRPDPDGDAAPEDEAYDPSPKADG